MLIPKRNKVEFAIEILKKEIEHFECHIVDYPDDPDAEADGGWTKCIEDLNEVVNWIKCRECIVDNGNDCDGPIEIRSLYMDQLEIPACLAHYEDMQKVKIED